ncbi:MAG: hypothetical protein R3C24_04690 [Cyanobacteriota/Melainabacteria group bacterium]
MNWGMVVLNNTFESVRMLHAWLPRRRPQPASLQPLRLWCSTCSSGTYRRRPDLIERSFGQFMTNQLLEPLYVDQMEMEAELAHIESTMSR